MQPDINISDIFEMVFAVSEEVKKVKCISTEMINFFESNCESKEDFQNILCGFAQNKILFDILNDYLFQISNQVSEILSCENKFVNSKT